jgi:hypothetical protein
MVDVVGRDEGFYETIILVFHSSDGWVFCLSHGCSGVGGLVVAKLALVSKVCGVLQFSTITFAVE